MQLSKMDETTIPLLPCVSPDELLEFYQALGFEVTYRQTKPYLYLAFRWSGFELHFRSGAKELSPEDEKSGGCLIMVTEVESYYLAFITAMRKKYGKVLVSGLPRITRFRKGQSRFTIIDPSGNSLIFIQRDEPPDLEYGGSKTLTGLAKAIDNARIFRDFKNDDKGAARILDSALVRFGTDAPPIDRARALVARAELAVILDDSERAEDCRAELKQISLTDAERSRLELETVDELERSPAPRATEDLRKSEK